MNDECVLNATYALPLPPLTDPMDIIVWRKVTTDVVNAFLAALPDDASRKEFLGGIEYCTECGGAKGCMCAECFDE